MATRESSAALKLANITELDPRVHEPERVKEKIREALERGDFTLKDIAKFTSFAPPTISQVLNDKYEADATKIVNAIVRFWKNWIAKHSIIQTQAAALIQNRLGWIWRRRLVGLIYGDNGRGKSTAAQSYCAMNPDHTAYLVLDQTTHIIDAMNTLATALGIESQMSGPASFRKAAIIRALQRNPKLIVIDEADEIKPRLLSILRTIYGDNDGRCGIALIGTTMLERTIKSIRYMDTRIGMRVRVPEMEDADGVKLIDGYEHDLEPAEKRELVKWANLYSSTRGGIRALRNLMNLAQDLSQESETDIDGECIKEAKKLL